MAPLNSWQMVAYGFPRVLWAHVEPGPVGLLNPPGLCVPLAMLIVHLALRTVIDVWILIVLLVISWSVILSAGVVLLLMAIRLVMSRVVTG